MNPRRRIWRLSIVASVLWVLGIGAVIWPVLEMDKQIRRAWKLHYFISMNPKACDKQDNSKTCKEVFQEEKRRSFEGRKLAAIYVAILIIPPSILLMLSRAGLWVATRFRADYTPPKSPSDPT